MGEIEWKVRVEGERKERRKKFEGNTTSIQ